VKKQILIDGDDQGVCLGVGLDGKGREGGGVKRMKGKGGRPEGKGWI